MKKTCMILIAIFLLAGCTQSGDSAEVAKLKQTIAERDKSIETLINEKETLQALLDQVNPDVLQQSTVVYTAIPLLMASEGKCGVSNSVVKCELVSTNAVLTVPISAWPSFMYILNPTPNQIYLVYYDEKELWVYGDYSIVSKAEADAILKGEGSASIIKTFTDGRVLLKSATAGIALSDPAAIDAFNTQFKDKLNGEIDVVLNILANNG
ncbi:MAG: hypothetical protein WBL80_01200 [Erysipelotrichaceae bacterium]